MAANPSQLGAVEFADETLFGENVNTWDGRLPVLGRVDTTGLKQPKVEIDIARQRLNEGTQDLRGPMGGEVSMEFVLPGLGSTCAGAVPSSDMATFLGYVFGTSATSAASGTTYTSAADGDTLTTVASGTFTAGSMCRIGALGDTDGEGQFYAIQSHSGTTLQLLNETTTTATTGVVYTGRMVYPRESPSTAGDITSLRFSIRTANQQYRLHGCYPTSGTFSDLGPGKQPKVRVTFAVAWWETANETFPVSTTMQTHAGTVVAAGSLFYNAVGTDTYAVRSVRDFEISVSMENVPLMGPGGVNEFQAIVGARRVKQRAMVSWVEDAEAAGTNTIDTHWTTSENSIVNKHALYTLCTRDGASAGFYFPNLVVVGDRPVQAEMNGLNTVRWNFRADTGTTTTTDLTMSSWRLCMA